MVRRMEYHSATSVPSAAKPTSMVKVSAMVSVAEPARSPANSAMARLSDREDDSTGECVTTVSSDRVAGLRGERDRMSHERDVERHGVARRDPIAASDRKSTRLN